MAARIALAFLVAFLAAATAPAQTWPSKPVRYVVPFPPAGATDILARIIAERISGPLGQPVVVENRPGVAGNVGTEMVARSPADGYTMLQATAAQAISETLYTKRSFSFEHDLAATAMIARMPNVMVVNPSVPAKSVAEFIALAKSKPGKLNFAASGSGTSLHMAGEMFKMMTGEDIVLRINGEVNKALVQAEMRERLLQQGAIATAWTPEQFGSFIHDEVVKWAKVVRASGAKVE